MQHRIKSVLRAKLPTSVRLWGCFSLALFAVLGFTPLFYQGKGGESYWDEWTILFSGESIDDRGVLVFGLGLLGLIHAIPSIIAGWVMQAVVVVGVVGVRATRNPGNVDSCNSVRVRETAGDGKAVIQWSRSGDGCPMTS
jgi:hypothetical protein